MADWNGFNQGIKNLGDGVYAWLQPNGSWGLNNTALICSDGEALLVDATVDVPSTQRMLADMRTVEAAAGNITQVVLTHWHVDHVHGLCAQELGSARVFATQICAEYLKKLPPARWLEAISALEGDARLQIERLIQPQFDFTGLHPIRITDTFEGALPLRVGQVGVDVLEAAPCHTRSDSVVFIPHAGIVHMGDLVRAKHHIGVQYPFMTNLLTICRKALDFQARIYIPGHGPLLDIADLREIVEYLEFIQFKVRERFERGMTVDEATDDLLSSLERFQDYAGAENLWFTVKMLFCEFAGDKEDYVRRDYPAYLAKQWRLHHQVRQCHPRLFAFKGVA